MRPEDVARLSPLGYKHRDFLGQYSVDLAKNIARGASGSLRTSERQKGCLTFVLVPMLLMTHDPLIPDAQPQAPWRSLDALYSVGT